MANVNVVVLEGNLTRDPELKSLDSGNSICKLRIAVNERTKANDEWVDRANYFDVTVWGKHGENVAKFLSKGSYALVSGRLRWREWETDDGGKRQSVEVVAQDVRFGPKNPNAGNGSSAAPTSDVPAGEDVPVGSAAGASDAPNDDIPF